MLSGVTTTVLGSTNVATTGSTRGALVQTGGTLILDPTAGPSPGPITFQTVNGTALEAFGGTITVSNAGVSVQTVGGHAFLANGIGSTVTIANGANVTTTGVGAALAAINGGTLNATGVVVNNTATATPTISAGHGAIAEAGATVNLHAGTTITTAAFNSVALGASGANSRVVPDVLVPVTLNGRGSMGVYMHDGGLVTLLPGSTLQMNATSSIGVAVDNTTVPLGMLGSGLTINLNGAGIPSQAASTGLVAFNGANVAIENLTVTGPNAAAGVWARPNSTITLSGANTININAAQNPTYYTLATANLITSAGPVSSIFSVTSAIPAAGLKSDAGLITSTGTTINVTSGNGAAGINTTAAGVVDITRNTVVTTGTNSFGVRIDSGQVTGRDSSVTTSGGGAALFFNFGPGVMDFTNTPVLATGADTTGLASLNGTASATNTVRLSGGSLISTQSSAIQAQGPLDVSVTNGAVVTGGGGFLLEAFDQNSFFPQATFVRLDASGGSILTGDAMAEALSRVDISLATGSRWTGAAFDITNVTVDPTSTWTVTASSNVTQQVANAGLIAFTPPVGDPTQLTSFKTLTTMNYIGAGGTLGLNTFLGSDGSPSDRLVINGGSATGNSLLRVTNATGPGALTTGNGIQVVQVVSGGTTVPGAFALNGIVAAGAYDYLLFRGGVTPGAENDWFLRSSIDCSAPNAPRPPCPAPPPPPPPPPDPPTPNPPTPNPPVPPGPIPLYRPEAALYTKVPLVARQMALFTLGTFHERQGDQILFPGPRAFVSNDTSLTGANAALTGASGNWQVPGTAAWGRFYGQQTEQRWAGPLSPEFSGRMAAAQFGFDVAQFESLSGHTDRLGVFYAFANVAGDGRGFILAEQRAIAGTLSINSHNPGAYWTHIGPSGWYVDAVLMGTFFDVETRSHRGVSAEMRGDGITASIEAGVPFRFSPYLSVEAQGQLIYQHTRFDTAADPFTTLRFGLDDNLVGRLGLRMEGDVRANGARLQPFALANLWHAFSGTDSTVFNEATTLQTPFEATALEVGGGIVARLSDNHGVYARATYTTNLGGNFRETIKAGIGARIIW